MARLCALAAWLWFSGAAKQPDLDLGALFEGLGALQNTGKGGKGSPRADACPAGQSPVPKLDQHSRMTANGCGPQGLVVKEPHGLFRCCNSHDVCFSVCGTSHDFCEDEFSKCMKEVCQTPLSGEHQECKQQAQSFSSMTKVFGSGFHKASQQDSCQCVPKDEAGQKHREYLETFYRLYNESMLDTQTLESQLSQWKGKEAELYFDLVKRYGHLFVQFDDVPKEFVHIPEAGAGAIHRSQERASAQQDSELSRSRLPFSRCLPVSPDAKHLMACSAAQADKMSKVAVSFLTDERTECWFIRCTSWHVRKDQAAGIFRGSPKFLNSNQVLLYRGSDEDQDGPCWKLSWKEDGDDDEDSDEANDRILLEHLWSAENVKDEVADHKIGWDFSQKGGTPSAPPTGSWTSERGVGIWGSPGKNPVYVTKIDNPPLTLLLSALGLAKKYIVEYMVRWLMEATWERLTAQTFEQILSTAILLDISPLRMRCLRFAETCSEIRSRYDGGNITEPLVSFELQAVWPQRETKRRRVF
ncbi:Pla2g12a [Symbiodinium natans]|uniref:Pla2g12a protein n=1 Tax=Symbiodinium natans TaxID=878477 RepID=A0A812QH68_9DINO|nr:Pla2g12a [Symbiodinium natans]